MPGRAGLSSTGQEEEGFVKVRIIGLALGATLAVAPAAQAQDTTAPTLNVATLSPAPATGHNNWYKTSPVTLNLSAADDVGVARFQYSTNAGQTFTDVNLAAPVSPATATVEITQEGLGNNAVRYRAVDAAGNTSAPRQISVRIDLRAPLVSWPAIVDGRVGHAARLIPTRTDPPPGSGGVAVLDMWLDGKLVYPLPVSTSDLDLGGHRITVKLGDAAGNAALHTQRFVVTTSFADVTALIASFVAAGDVSAESGAALTAKLAEAQALADAGSTSDAIRALDAFRSLVRRELDRGEARETLDDDADYLVDRLRGKPEHDFETGLTTRSATGPEFFPDPVLSPLPHNPRARYDVLVYSETTGFRHDHIPHTILAIQKLGIKHGFNVDVYDPQLPSVSMPASPFTSLETLAEYETIVFESTVGHNPGPLDPVTERPVFEAYMRGGGGYVGIHGAADSARGTPANQWSWYGNLVGGWFVNHPNGQSGFGHCGSCLHVEVIREDDEHPATEDLPPRWRIVDELYNFDRAPRADVHTLLSLNEDTYQRSLNSGNAANTPLVLMGGDHPIAWCQNWDGGKAFSQILGHARWLYYDDQFMDVILGGIQTTADRKDANCSSFRETRLLIAEGSLTEEATAQANALLDSAQASYLAKEYRDAERTLDDLADLADRRSTGSHAARAALEHQAEELEDWMDELD
jgi:type 1 glutamine amidotransferase